MNITDVRLRKVEGENSIKAIASITFGLFSSTSSLHPAWVSCYIIGYAIGLNKKNGYIKYSWPVLIFGLSAIATNGVQVYLDYVKHKSFEGTVGLLYSHVKNYNHVLLGVFIFLVLYAIFSKIQLKSIAKKILSVSDKYSYEIYLVHQFFILGPLSLMALTTIRVADIFIVLLCVCLSAFILQKLEIMINIIKERLMISRNKTSN